MKKTIYVLLWVLGLGTVSAFAQSTDVKTDASLPVKAETQVLAGDPIVAMLDSLVKLNSKLRYGSINAASRPRTSEIPEYTPDQLRERMKKIVSPISMDYNDQVKAYIDLYAVRKKDLTATVMGLSQLYFPMFEQTLDQQGLPLEFKYLAVIESALNPLAVSRCGATGLWQFMYETGRQYNLGINSYVDERRDPQASTLAACKYFKNMYAIYHDWLLVIAAYNCGPGNVNRAIARSGGKRNFWEISKYLPQETRGYVPAFIAVNYVMNYAKEHNISPIPPPMSYFEVDTVGVQHSISFNQVASAIDVPVAVIQYLNPSYKTGVVPPSAHKQTLRLPMNKASVFAAHTEEIYRRAIEQENLATKAVPYATVADANATYDYVTKEVRKIHVVRRKENMIGIAQAYKCSIKEIKNWNRLKSGKVRPGQKLIVYATVTQKIQRRQEAAAESTPVVASAEKATAVDSLAQLNDAAVAAVTEAEVAESKPISAPKGKVKYIYHIVQRGDTLWNIAQRYQNGSIEKIREINDSRALKRLIPGTKIKVGVTAG